jgi:hypothetical protein
MSKGTFFTGQPIFSQILNFIPRAMVQSIARDLHADRYCKTFGTYEHLVTMLYAVFNQCNSLREVTTGLLAWEHRIHHLGIGSHPRRSTLADANKRRSEQVFEKIYFKLLSRYMALLPDSRKRASKNNLYIFDATTISLFQEILKGSGLSKPDGRRKGGIKVHALLRADLDVPCLIRHSAAAANDAQFLNVIHLPAGSVIVFDKGYRDYSAYNRFTQQRITWVTRHRDHSVYRVQQQRAITDYHRQHGVCADLDIELGHDHSTTATKVAARMVRYKDPVTGKQYEFITNNRNLSPLSIANFYRCRWQIETFFKRIKQNYPLQYFLGDNENAIKIQIWCALIADLLIKVIKRGTRSSMAFSNIAGLIRVHMMTYMDLKSFLRAPEKSLLRRVQLQTKNLLKPPLFSP